MIEAKPATTQHELVGWGSTVPFPNPDKPKFKITLDDVESLQSYKELGMRWKQHYAKLKTGENVFLLTSKANAAEKKQLKLLPRVG